jgi:hypothetical protein
MLVWQACGCVAAGNGRQAVAESAFMCDSSARMVQCNARWRCNADSRWGRGVNRMAEQLRVSPSPVGDKRLRALDAGGADPFGNAIDSLRKTIEIDTDAWIGRGIGDFHLVRLLGKGGMGVVFLADRQACDFEQWVAVKLLRGNRLESAAIERFAAGPRILATACIAACCWTTWRRS